MNGIKWRVIAAVADDFRVSFPDSEFWSPGASHPEWNDPEQPRARQTSSRWDLMARPIR